MSYHRVSNLFGREAKRPRRKKKPPHGSEPFAGRLRKQPRWWALSELLRRQT